MVNKMAGLIQIQDFWKHVEQLSWERFTGHHKIIRYADGLPVYSAWFPPSNSSAFANIQVNIMFSGLQHRPLPYLVSIALTDECNARCEHCSFFNRIDDPSKQPLSTEEIKDAIRQAQDIGACVINFVGGEPLMHPDWREIFQSIDKRKSHVFFFTNGWFLAESATDVKAVGIGGVYVSIDSSQSKIHDQKRGIAGLFAKAMDGIAAAKKADLTVGISSCIDEQAFESGELDNIIELAKRQGVHEVLVFDAKPVGRFCDRNDLKGSLWTEKMFEHIKKYNDDEKYPGILLYARATSHTGLGCPGGTCYFYMTPYGDICPCDFHSHKFGNVREEKLPLIWDKMVQQLGMHGSNWHGCWAKRFNS